MSLNQNGMQFTAETIADRKGMEVKDSKHFNEAHGRTITQKQTPCLGDSIEIKHEVKRDTSGQFVLGLQRNGRSINTEITQTYLDGTIATGHGDIWEVKLSEGRCKWETVNTFVKKDEEV